MILLLMFWGCAQDTEAPPSQDDAPPVEVCNGKDDDNDGIIDNGVLRFQLEQLGENPAALQWGPSMDLIVAEGVVELTIETDKPGRARTWTRRSYDDHGTLLHELFEEDDYVEDDSGGESTDGVVDERTQAVYSNTGNLMLSETHTLDNEAHLALSNRELYLYDDNDNCILYEQDTVGAEDNESNADGIVDERKVYTYDTMGLFSSTETDTEGAGEDGNLADGIFETQTHRWYNVNGSMMRQEVVQNDGVTERLLYSYSADGRLDMIATDTTGAGEEGGDADGIIDKYKRYTYDDQRRLTAETYVNVSDDDAQDAEDEWSSKNVYTYDDNGNLVSWESLIDPESPNAYIRNVFTYDDDNRLIRVEWDYMGGGDGSDSDGVTDYTETFEFDDDGNLSRKTSFGSDPNTPFEIVAYTYDDDGNLLHMTIDDDGGGDDGYNADGVVDMTYTYAFTCR